MRGETEVGLDFKEVPTLASSAHLLPTADEEVGNTTVDRR